MPSGSGNLPAGRVWSRPSMVTSTPLTIAKTSFRRSRTIWRSTTASWPTVAWRRGWTVVSIVWTSLRIEATVLSIWGAACSVTSPAEVCFRVRREASTETLTSATTLTSALMSTRLVTEPTAGSWGAGAAMAEPIEKAASAYLKNCIMTVDVAYIKWGYRSRLLLLAKERLK